MENCITINNSACGLVTGLWWLHVGGVVCWLSRAVVCWWGRVSETRLSWWLYGVRGLPTVIRSLAVGSRISWSSCKHTQLQLHFESMKPIQHFVLPFFDFNVERNLLKLKCKFQQANLTLTGLSKYIPFKSLESVKQHQIIILE